MQGFSDGDVLDLGTHKLRFLETPHVHHWDSMILFEETTRSVFPADLYIQPGEQPVTVAEDLGQEMCAYYAELGIFAHEDPVRAVADRLRHSRPSGCTPCTAARSPKQRPPVHARSTRAFLRV